MLQLFLALAVLAAPTRADPGCLSDDDARVRSLQSAFRKVLGSMDSLGIILRREAGLTTTVLAASEVVADSARCEQAAVALAAHLRPRPAPAGRLAVVRIGELYAVEPVDDPIRAGEWIVTVIFDAQWRRVAGLMN